MKKHFLIFTISLLFFSLAQGKVKLPAMMGDHMVLQQNSSVKLWGWADGKKVTVTTSWNNRTYKVSTDDEGAWLVKVDTPAGSFTPYSITISDGIRVTLSDILIGEVWICSGQSNMEMTMKGNMGQPIDNSLETLLNAGNYRDRIRFMQCRRLLLCPTTDGNASSPRRTGHQQLGRFTNRGMDDRRNARLRGRRKYRSRQKSKVRYEQPAAMSV